MRRLLVHPGLTGQGERTRCPEPRYVGEPYGAGEFGAEQRRTVDTGRATDAAAILTNPLPASGNGPTPATSMVGTSAATDNSEGYQL
ncbi:hypothetical protein EV643_108202 [Kribbella sp. VKM Ac-2527]|uniref:Uncharacterized protein n=1 Tax=Kribbella caucasensis TaxID=2512215 RepID=A0A4R6KCU9_9ACTN|nr:hypothetical protein EV643_108202 [Kribbella sp. VKM Ac-2527]